MAVVMSNRNRNFSDELDHVSNQVNDNMDDGCLDTMDEKRVRKAVFRRTIDYNSSVTLHQEQRLIRRIYSQRNALQPDNQYQHLLTPPQDYKDNPMNCVCVKHVRTSTNKNKCPIYSVCWTPDGRRLITAASSGEFTLWNGLTFNFETILQAHDTYIKAMKWSHNEDWLLSGDDLGMVKYWQANMNDVNVFQAHKDAIRGLSFCPSDKKFVTCSVDNTVRIWDFQMCKEERVLRGHGGEVKCVAWHPTKALVLSGSKDSQQPLKLWDPKAGECISTMYVHKSSCNDIAINKNGNWFLSASKDHTIKLFDLRNLKAEMQIFRGHKKDVFRVAWNPFHENLFASGSGDGALMYWLAGTDMEVGSVDDAHDNIIWSIDWHPMGHILATGSNDFATKFWTRNRPGDVLKDNLQVDHNVSSAKTVEASHSTDAELDKIIKRVKTEQSLEEYDLQRLSSSIEADLEKNEKLVSDIPGLSEGMVRDIDIDTGDEDADERDAKLRGTSYRVIPKQFVLNWADKKKHPAAYISKEPNQPIVPPPIIVVPQTVEPLYPSLSAVVASPGPSIKQSNSPKQFPNDRSMTLFPTARDTPQNFQNPPRRPATPDFVPSQTNRFKSLENIELNEQQSLNHNGQNFPRFPPRRFPPQPRPFGRRMAPEFSRQRNRDSEDDDELEEDDRDEFRGHRSTNSFDRDRPLYAPPLPPPPPHQRPLPRNIHPSNPDFLFERPLQRLPSRSNEPKFSHANPQRMFPLENRFEMGYQRPTRNFVPGNNERPFMGPMRPLMRPFRPPPSANNQFDLHQPLQRPLLRHASAPNHHHSDNQFHPPPPQQPQARLINAGASNNGAVNPNNAFDNARHSSENPFEPQKSTGSSKGFIPLPFNADDPVGGKRVRPSLGARPGPNW